MARGDQLARQWIIFQQLMKARYGKTVNDLAADLDCHPRTVYRDLDALQAAGFPIYNEKVNGTNFWALLEDAKKPVPIPFSLPELIALYFGRDVLRILKNTHSKENSICFLNINFSIRSITDRTTMQEENLLLALCLAPCAVSNRIPTMTDKFKNVPCSVKFQGISADIYSMETANCQGNEGAKKCPK